MSLVTVPNVELLEVGQGWQLGTGTRDFSTEDLISAIESQNDPGVRTPIVKLGHVDPRFDGQPAVGRITNLRLSNNGMTLVGDLEGVPSWLCEVNAEGDYILASAYPRRSIEGVVDKVTATGNKWSLILTGLALLGDAYPAITTLEDIGRLFGDEAPELLPVEELPELVASSPQEVNTVPARRVLASITMDEVRTAYYDSLASNQMWWWIRTVLVDPFELIVDDDEGHLHRVPVTVSGDAITFGDPIEVAIEYRDVAVAAGARIAASYSDHEAAGRPVRASDEEVAPPGVTVPPSEEVDVNLSETALAALGLQPGATEDEINAAIVAKAQAAAAQPTAGEGEPAPEKPGEPSTGTPPPAPPDPATPAAPAPGTPPEKPGEGEPSPEKEGTSQPMGIEIPAGFKLIDEATLEALKSGVAEAQELVNATRKQQDEELLASAVRSGKIMASRLPDYRAALERDREGTKQLLASLADGLVPLEARGTGNDTPASEATEYPSEWASTVAAAHRGISGSRIKVVGD